MSEATTVNEAVINQIARDVHATALEKGFWEPPHPFIAELCTKLALIHTEVSEALGVLRDYYEGEINPYTMMTEEQGHDFIEELMDVVIRVFDVAGYLSQTAGSTMLAKMTKNRARPVKHGKRF